MNNNDVENYRRVAQALNYLENNFKAQPNLAEVAEVVGLSEFYFQRLFSDWVGVSPKKFLQYLTIGYAREVLAERSLMGTSLEAGLSGTGRLHDLFVSVEGMTPGEYKNNGDGIKIDYSIQETPFGRALVASTDKGICYLGFFDGEVDQVLADLWRRFPEAKINDCERSVHGDVFEVYFGGKKKKINLHLRGTGFQLKIWEALLKIPEGGLASYGEVAKCAASPNASRAVGTAIGANPVSLLIPCHRVIRSSGVIGNYMWGRDRKKALIGWEAAKRAAS